MYIVYFNSSFSGKEVYLSKHKTFELAQKRREKLDKGSKYLVLHRIKAV